MARTTVDHVIQTLFDGRGTDLAVSAFGQVDRAVRAADDALMAAGRNAAGFSLRNVADTFNEVTDMAGRVVTAMESAWETLGQGAAIQQSLDRWDALAESIGSSGDALTAQLRAATQGALTQAQIATSIGSLIEMGLVSGAEQATELADLIIRLKKPTDDASASFANFGLTIANMSFERLDAFGISSGSVRAAMAELMETTAGLTKEQAFLEAVLSQGRISLERTGRETGEVVAGYEQLSTRLAETKEQFLVALYEGMEPFINEAAEFVDTHGPELAEAIHTVSAAVVTLSGLTLQAGELFHREFVEPVARGLGELETRLDPDQMNILDVIGEMIELETRANLLERELTSVGIASSELAALWDSLARNTISPRDAVRSLRDYIIQLEEKLLEHTAAVEGTNASLITLSYTVPAVTDAMLEYGRAAAGAGQEVGQVDEAVHRSLDGWNRTTVGLEDVQAAFAAVRDRMQEVRDTSREYFQSALEAESPTFDLAGALFSAASAAGLSAGGMRDLAREFLIYTPATIDAALQTSYLRLALDEVVVAFGRGEISADQARIAWEEFERRANAADFSPLSAEFAALLGQLREIAGEHRVKIIPEIVFPPDLPSGSGQWPKGDDGGDAPAGPPLPDDAFAMGGWTGAAGGIVHPYELVVPQPVVAAGGMAMLDFANRHVPGGVPTNPPIQQTIYIQAPDERALAFQLRLIRQQSGARLAEYFSR